MAPEPSQGKKKKKNAPDRQQPKWMFPPDEENPVLNPKPVSEERKSKAKEEWDEAYKLLKYQSVTAPMKAPPPAMLLTLVGAFLTSYGFNSTSRIYTTQLASREKLDEWKVELGVKLPTGFPDLVKIYKDWYKQYQEKIQLDMTSSDEDDSDDTKAAKLMNKKQISDRPAVVKTESTSSSGSSSSGNSDNSGDESNSDVEIERTKPSNKPMPSAVEAGSSSSASWATDSDADDEKESAGAKLAVAKPPSIASPSNSSSSSSSGSESEAPPPPKTSKKPKSSSKKSSNAAEQPSKKPSLPKPAESSSKVSTDSSVTLQPPSPTKPVPNSSSSSSSSDSSLEPPPPTTTITKTKPSKRKRPTAPPPSAPPTTVTPEATDPPTKKHKTSRNLPFQRVPSDTKIDPKLASNAYRTHDYGDRAHHDLSVTRGKGFTKEKNKKKRGSYRGGAIDVSGGKGIKFE